MSHSGYCSDPGNETEIVKETHCYNIPNNHLDYNDDGDIDLDCRAMRHLKRREKAKLPGVGPHCCCNTKNGVKIIDALELEVSKYDSDSDDY
jgi:hypothetical protein